LIEIFVFFVLCYLPICLPLIEGQIVPRSINQPLVRQVEYGLVLGDKDTILDREVVNSVIVVERLVVTVTDDTHHRLDQSLAGTHVPHFETWDLVQVQVRLLIHHVNHFVAGASYSSDMLRVQRCKNLVHGCLITVHTSANPQIVIILVDCVI
jgi:hypothetical protein